MTAMNLPDLRHKTITIVAAMMLVDRGKCTLDEPSASTFLPCAA